MPTITRVFRALFEIGGLLNDLAGALIGLAFAVFGYCADLFWLMPLGAFGIAISLYRFGAHLSQWRRASNPK
jgi:membrane protein required for beta-lactamase induction